MKWRIETGQDEDRAERVTEQLVEHNKAASEIVRVRFLPEHLRSNPLAAYAVTDDGTLLGGCTGYTEDIWHWLTVDILWVDPSARGSGVGSALLTAVEDQARERGCRWAKLNTFDFQAPEFYARHGYTEYGREEDYPPGHVNHLMRKDF